MEIDYKKEYEAMVQRARELHETGNELTKRQMEIVCQGLRESEDEEIRKHIIDLVKDNAKAKSIPCDAEIAYLEKQKENPKTADSIPSDCASDAKCEDRWHKVGDSLPDNGRLVLANDCLGNTLLARYDGEGNWEVSVYDNDDYYCRNTITKWCDIPSEKQKEQKPPIAGNDFGWIDELKHDLEHPEELDQKVDDVLKQRNGTRALEWSEEDREMKLKILKYLSTRCSVNEFEEVENWLNNLRPSWKPSEEQMEAYHAILLNNTMYYTKTQEELFISLYNDLKKLM